MGSTQPLLKRYIAEMSDKESTTSSSAIDCCSLTSNSDSDSDSVDVEKFLTDVFAQQIKEKNTRIVKGRSGMVRGSRVEAAVVPIISSATNIRDYYVRQLKYMS